MGGVSSAEKNGGFELEDVESQTHRHQSTDTQSPLWPWTAIIGWSCGEVGVKEFDGGGEWSIADIKADVEGLTQLEGFNHEGDAFEARCVKDDEGEGGLPKGTFNFEEGVEDDRDLDKNPFVAWAAALLVSNPSLSAARFRLVPARMSERVFWGRYFATVRSRIRSRVLPPPPLVTPQSSVTPAACLPSSGSQSLYRSNGPISSAYRQIVTCPTPPSVMQTTIIEQRALKRETL